MVFVSHQPPHPRFIFVSLFSLSRSNTSLSLPLLRSLNSHKAQPPPKKNMTRFLSIPSLLFLLSVLILSSSPVVDARIPRHSNFKRQTVTAAHSGRRGSLELGKFNNFPDCIDVSSFSFLLLSFDSCLGALELTFSLPSFFFSFSRVAGFTSTPSSNPTLLSEGTDELERKP